MTERQPDAVSDRTAVDSASESGLTVPEFVSEGKYTILLVEPSPLLGALFERWLEPLDVRHVSSVDAIPEALDSSVAVACLAQSTVREHAPELRTKILGANPYCQLITILPRGEFLTVHEDQYDATLQRPLFRWELQSTVERSLYNGLYSRLLRRFYFLNAKIHWQSPGGEDGQFDAETSELFEQYRRVCGHLQELSELIDEDALVAIKRSIERHKQWLKSPAPPATEASNSKFHPTRCPKCKLAWGVDHGNELGSGFETVAAHVRRCTDCGEIVHGVGSGHRRVLG